MVFKRTAAALFCIILCGTCICACKGGNTESGIDSISSTTASLSSDSGTLSSDSSLPTVEISGGETGTDGTVSTAPSSGAADTQKPSENTAPQIYLASSVSGNKVSVTANIRNNPGLSAYSVKLKYDEKSIKPLNIVKGITSVTSNLQQSTDCGGNVTAVYVDAVGFRDDGVLFTVEFELSNNTTATEISLIKDASSFLSQNGTDFIDLDVSGTEIK